MEISFEPYKKLSFRSYLEYDSPEDLARNIALSIPSGVPVQATLRWSNGVLFAIAAFQQSESVSKEYLAGHVLYDHIDFALMSKYQKTIKLPEKPMVAVNITNLSEHPLFGNLGEWIKGNLAKKKIPHPRRSG
jgi:hypothetical protein